MQADGALVRFEASMHRLQVAVGACADAVASLAREFWWSRFREELQARTRLRMEGA